MSTQHEKLDRQIEDLKSEIANIEGVGKDVLLRLEAAFDEVQGAIRSSVAVGQHDANDTLVAATDSPEDHPREQGETHPTVAEQASPELEVPPAERHQNPERRTGSESTPEPELPASDPVQGKDHLDTDKADPSTGETPAGVNLVDQPEER